MKPVHDRGADAPRSDHADGQVAQFLSPHVVQPVVVSSARRTMDLAFRSAMSIEHQRVVGDAVGRIGDVADSKCRCSRRRSASMWL